MRIELPPLVLFFARIIVLVEFYSHIGFVPLGRGLFGDPLGPNSSVIPFAVATEFPDQNYSNMLHHRQGDPRETNFLVCGKIDLTRGTVIPIYDYTPPLREKRNKKV